MYTRGWIRMQMVSAMVDMWRWIPSIGIANSNAELTYSDVVLLMSYLSGRLGKTIEWNCLNSRDSIPVATVIDYLEVVLNTPSSNKFKLS